MLQMGMGKSIDGGHDCYQLWESMKNFEFPLADFKDKMLIGHRFRWAEPTLVWENIAHSWKTRFNFNKYISV